jgi:hypothetical protein
MGGGLYRLEGNGCACRELFRRETEDLHRSL